MAGKYFSHYWPFVWGIHLSQVDWKKHDVISQVSHIFSEIKFKDISWKKSTFFKQHRIIIWCIANALFCLEKTSHTPNYNIHSLYFNYIQPICCGSVYNPKCTLENTDQQISNDGKSMTKFMNCIIIFKNKKHIKYTNRWGFCDTCFSNPWKVIFKHFLSTYLGWIMDYVPFLIFLLYLYTYLLCDNKRFWSKIANFQGKLKNEAFSR